jgi:hypothetical protein
VNPQVRRVVLGVTLAASLLAAGWVTSGEEHAAADLQPVIKSRAAAVAPESVIVAAPVQGPLNVERLRREVPPPEPDVADLFTAKSWFVPPPPPPPQPPSPPSAPALPFKYMGRMIDGGTDTVFLIRADKTYTVKAGDTLDATYRVERIDAAALTLTYLPLNLQQSLPIGSAN